VTRYCNRPPIAGRLALATGAEARVVVGWLERPGRRLRSWRHVAASGEPLAESSHRHEDDSERPDYEPEEHARRPEMMTHLRAPRRRQPGSDGPPEVFCAAGGLRGLAQRAEHLLQPDHRVQRRHGSRSLSLIWISGTAARYLFTSNQKSSKSCLRTCRLARSSVRSSSSPPVPATDIARSCAVARTRARGGTPSS
jgi:hypothetical protein